MKRILIILILLYGTGGLTWAKDYDIRDFGAVPDGTSINTTAIQSAIDLCSSEGGGKVYIAGGDFVTGTLFLKDGVTLYVEALARLLASSDPKDYPKDVHKNMYRREPHMDRCLIFARKVKNIGFEGKGSINGRGNLFPQSADPGVIRPMLIRLVECEGIRMRDLTLQSPAAWTSAWLYCNDIVVDGITIHARANWNGDGLDFDGCSNVRVSNCSFDTSDDSICLQTSRKDRSCENVVITNCIFISQWAGIRIGLLSRSNFENVTVSNCIFRDIKDSGLKIQMNEGAEMKNLMFNDLIMTNVPRPIFMTLCGLRCYVDGEEDYPPVGSIGHISFNNIRIDNSACDKNAAIILTGVPEKAITDIALNNISMIVGGGGTAADAKTVLNDFTKAFFESQDSYVYPEYFVLGGVVPTSGIYLRHIDTIRINNFYLQKRLPDERPEIVKIDVRNSSISK